MKSAKSNSPMLSPDWSKSGGKKVVLSTLSTPTSSNRAYVLTKTSVTGCDLTRNTGGGANSLVKWSVTGSLPMLAQSGASFRRYSEVSLIPNTKSLQKLKKGVFLTAVRYCSVFLLGHLDHKEP